MPGSGSQLSAPQRPKWFHLTMGIGLIVVAVVLAVFWQILGSDTLGRAAREAGALRFFVYSFGQRIHDRLTIPEMILRPCGNFLEGGFC